MRSTTKLLMLLLLATATSAHACGGPSGGELLVILAACIVPGFMFGLFSRFIFPRLRYFESLACMFGLLVIFLLSLGIKFIGTADGLWIAVILGVLNSMGHVFGFILAAGESGTAQQGPTPGSTHEKDGQ